MNFDVLEVLQYTNQISDWPWVTEMPTFPPTMPNGEDWPRISVVTPSFNQAKFIEATIRSVLLQGYPNLEYIIIDGGSTDGSVEIIKKYEQHLNYWVSETDKGQSHAINKGFEKSTGEIMCWLNSDDFYLPETLKIVATNLCLRAGNFILVGHCLGVFTDGRLPKKIFGAYENYQRLLQFWKGYQMHQPAIFWRREVFEKIGYLDEEQHLIMDFDYWARMGRHFNFKDIDEVLAGATFHDQAKTGDERVGYHKDLRKNARHYWGSPYQLNYWKLHFSLFEHKSIRPFLSRVKRVVLRYNFNEGKKEVPEK